MPTDRQAAFVDPLLSFCRTSKGTLKDNKYTRKLTNGQRSVYTIRPLILVVKLSLLEPGKHHFLHVNDLTSEQVNKLLNFALDQKKQLKKEKKYQDKPLMDKTLAMIFAKPSARTRISFETGMFMLGGHALHLGEEVGLGKREAVKDVARVVSSMNDLIMARLFEHSDLLELAKYSKVPVINGLTDYNHPCQIVADALTILETKGKLDGIKVAYVGDGNNIVHSWLELACLVNIEFVCCCPSGYDPDSRLVDQVNKSQRGTAVIHRNAREAVQGADVIYTDVWASMGQKESLEERMRVFAPFQVTLDLIKATHKPDTIFMHCLPAERGRECDDEVMESSCSKVFQQAENRMHAQNAILLYCQGLLEKMI
eukprot:jgi/Galph1/3698/GphlegSOOS_G2320.1